MPSLESNIAPLYTVTNTRMIHPRTFEVAEQKDFKEALFLENFRRAVDGTYLLPEGIQLSLESRFPILKHSCQIIMFKRALKRELKSKNILFDQYRTGHMAAVDIDTLLQSCALRRDSIIDIHESDYSDYKLDILDRLVSCRLFNLCDQQQGLPRYYWMTDADVEKFAAYMEHWFLPSLDKVDLTRPLQDGSFDTRLILDDIFHFRYS